MKSWIVFGWGNGVFVARAFNDFTMADAKAKTYNAVLMEVHVCEKDFQTYVVAHDFEYQNKREMPQSAQWTDEMNYSVHGSWKNDPVPFVRVGKDISHKKYHEEHGEHG